MLLSPAFADVPCRSRSSSNSGSPSSGDEEGPSTSSSDSSDDEEDRDYNILPPRPPDHSAQAGSLPQDPALAGAESDIDMNEAELLQQQHGDNHFLFNDAHIVPFGAQAGLKIAHEHGDIESAPFSLYESALEDDSEVNVFAPFASEMDWRIAQWAKTRGPSASAFDELLVIDGVRILFDLLLERTLTAPCPR